MSEIRETVIEGYVVGMLAGGLLGLLIGIYITRAFGVPLGYSVYFFGMSLTIAGAIGGDRLGVIVIER